MTGVSDQPAARLRELIASGSPVLAPGVPDPLTAHIAAQLGFSNVYVSGAATSAVHGYPDMGLLDLADLVRSVRAIASAAGDAAPIVDLDTGFGGPVMIRRAMREVAAAGAAAVHIEDQPEARRCAYLSDQPCVPVPTMLERLHAALASGTGLVVVARTDALLVSGLEDAIARAQAYADAGAELVKVNGIQSLDELNRVAEAVDAPLLYNVSGSDRSPRVTLAQARDLGIAIVIYPIHASRAAVWGARQLLEVLARDDDPMTVPLEPFESWMELAGWSEAAAFEERVVKRNNA
jgi:2,3-dimethylmalate lyase